MHLRRLRIAKVVVALLAASSPSATAAAVDAAAAATPAWSIVPSPNGANLAFSSLSGVACTSVSNCFAVGGADNSKRSTALIAQWNGSKWSIVPSPNAGSDAALGAVSCATAKNCVAVGAHGSTTVRTTLMEDWNGSKWKIVSSPTPGPPGIIDVRGVSCANASSCLAVGYTYASDTGAFQPLVESWNGKRWSVVPSPNPHGNSSLGGVSCAGPKNCFAVGSYNKGTGSGPLIERWNGKAMSVASSPFPPGSSRSELAAVSCAAATSCMAVGWRRPGHGYGGLTERWNGKKWTILPSPRLTGVPNAQLYGVSCASGSSCVAVGSYTKPNFGVATLTEQWSGQSWTVGPSPNPASTWSELDATSCPNPTNCTAVGFFATDNGQKTLALKFS